MDIDLEGRLNDTGSSARRAALTARVMTVEATTLLVLLVCSVLKRTVGADWAVSVMGPVHGMAFVAYVLVVLANRKSLRWGAGRTVLTLLASIVPTLPYAEARRLRREHHH